jgi:hypothetical protein
MLVAIRGSLTVLDRVSQPSVFASLFEPLVQGYALDALGGNDVPSPSIDAAREVVERVAGAPILERDGLGLGRDVRLSAPELMGAGVVSAVELVQLSVFVAGDETVRGGSIRRPSRRMR